MNKQVKISTVITFTLIIYCYCISLTQLFTLTSILNCKALLISKMSIALLRLLLIIIITIYLLWISNMSLSYLTFLQEFLAVVEVLHQSHSE